MNEITSVQRQAFAKALFDLAANQPQSLDYVHSLLSELANSIPPDADSHSVRRLLREALNSVSSIIAVASASTSATESSLRKKTIYRGTFPEAKQDDHRIRHDFFHGDDGEPRPTLDQGRGLGNACPDLQVQMIPNTPENPEEIIHLPKFKIDNTGAISDIRCTSYLFSSELVHEFAHGKSRLALRRQDFLSVAYAVSQMSQSLSASDKFTVTDIKGSLTSNLGQSLAAGPSVDGESPVTDVPQTKLYVAIRLLRRFNFLQQTVENKRFYTSSWPDEWGAHCPLTLVSNVYAFWMQHVSMGEGRLDGVPRKAARNKLRHGLIDLTEYLRGMTDYELLVLAASFEDMCHTVDGPESSRTRSELIDLLLKKYQQVQF